MPSLVSFCLLSLSYFFHRHQLFHVSISMIVRGVVLAGWGVFGEKFWNFKILIFTDLFGSPIFDHITIIFILSFKLNSHCRLIDQVPSIFEKWNQIHRSLSVCLSVRPTNFYWLSNTHGTGNSHFCWNLFICTNKKRLTLKRFCIACLSFVCYGLYLVAGAGY